MLSNMCNVFRYCFMFNKYIIYSLSDGVPVSEMLRRRFRIGFSARYRHTRNIVSAMLITIILLIYMKDRMIRVYHSFNHKQCDKHAVLAEFSEKAKNYLNFGIENKSETLSANELRRWIQNQNAVAEVLNMELYGHITANTLIFVVQVHQYACNINYLLESLRAVEGIQDTLIIFSHSRVDHNVNHLLLSIDFCRILQLFYPYSIQAYPDEFPGYAKNYCSPNVNMEEAEEFNCTGALAPDIHGKHRDPTNAEKKHHWWWTANKVFAGLPHTIGHTGIVVFLEHNFYIHSNFIYIVYKMQTVAQTLHHCEFLSLGSKLDIKEENANSFQFTTWDPKYHSSILAMDISTWNSIESHYDIFCHIDDYSWSRSLFDVSINRRDGKMFKVLSSVAVRASQTSSCSSIGDMMDCNEVQNIIEILNLQKIYNRDFFFPAYFKILYNMVLYDDEDFSYVDYVGSYGGWSDERDKQLCSNMTINKAKKYFVTTGEKIDYKTVVYW